MVVCTLTTFHTYTECHVKLVFTGVEQRAKSIWTLPGRKLLIQLLTHIPGKEESSKVLHS